MPSGHHDSVILCIREPPTVRFFSPEHLEHKSGQNQIEIPINLEFRLLLQNIWKVSSIVETSLTPNYKMYTNVIKIHVHPETTMIVSNKTHPHPNQPVQLKKNRIFPILAIFSCHFFSDFSSNRRNSPISFFSYVYKRIGNCLFFFLFGPCPPF
jgi:hypothetical protein